MDSPQLPLASRHSSPQVDRFAKTAAVTEANLIRLERRKWGDVASFQDVERFGFNMLKPWRYHMGRRRILKKRGDKLVRHLVKT